MKQMSKRGQKDAHPSLLEESVGIRLFLPLLSFFSVAEQLRQVLASNVQ
jgi:hypothetical protein